MSSVFSPHPFAILILISIIIFAVTGRWDLHLLELPRPDFGAGRSIHSHLSLSTTFLAMLAPCYDAGSHANRTPDILT